MCAIICGLKFLGILACAMGSERHQDGCEVIFQVLQYPKLNKQVKSATDLILPNSLNAELEFTNIHCQSNLLKDHLLIKTTCL